MRMLGKPRVSDPIGSGVFACFESRSGFQISLDPYPGTKKKSAERALKILKIMTKDCQKMKKAIISY